MWRPGCDGSVATAWPRRRWRRRSWTGGCEQPLDHEDLVEHARLQARLATPICLDEAIRSASDATAALDMGACRIINIKPGRVGGILEAKRIHDVAVTRDAPVWIGGMLET